MRILSRFVRMLLIPGILGNIEYRLESQVGIELFASSQNRFIVFAPVHDRHTPVAEEPVFRKILPFPVKFQCQFPVVEVMEFACKKIVEFKDLLIRQVDDSPHHRLQNPRIISFLRPVESIKDFPELIFRLVQLACSLSRQRDFS